jgi:hypothetical protein
MKNKNRSMKFLAGNSHAQSPWPHVATSYFHE